MNFTNEKNAAEACQSFCSVEIESESAIWFQRFKSGDFILSSALQIDFFKTHCTTQYIRDPILFWNMRENHGNTLLPNIQAVVLDTCLGKACWIKVELLCS